MAFLEFQKFSFNHIFFLCYFISSFTRQRIKDALFDVGGQISGDFYKVYIGNISHFLTIIPLLIKKHLSKSNNINHKEKNKKDERSINYIYYEKIANSNNRSKLKTMFLVSIYDFLAEAIIIVFYFINNKREVYSYYSLRILSLFNTIMQYIASYFILTNHLYRHHYFSLLINFFCLIIFLIIDIIKIVEKSITDYQFYIFCFIKLLRLGLFCFGDNYVKYAFYSEIVSPYSIELYKAIYKNIFLIIFSIPFIFLNTSDSYIESSSVFTGFIFYFQDIKILYTFCFIVLQFLYDLFLVIIIDRFSPNHTPLILIGEEICNFALDLIFVGKFHIMGFFKYIRIVLYLISLFGVLLHNEIIVINVCDLGSDTKYFLDDIAKNEEIYNTTDDPDIIKRFETLEMIDFTDDESETN